MALAEARSLIDAGRYEDAEAAAKVLADDVSAEDRPLAKARALDLWVEARWRNGRAWHPGTLEAAEWAEELKAEAAGAASPEVADSLFHQARVLDEWGRYDEAREIYHRAIDLYRKSTDVSDPRSQVAAVQLGGLLVELGQLRAARPYLEGGLQSLVAVLGPDHPQVAEALLHLGWLEAYSRNLEIGQAHFERALSILEEQLGPDHPSVGDPLDGLTMVLRDLNDFDGARRAGRRALHTRMQALGEDHPSLVPGLLLLWWVGADQNEENKAIESAAAIAQSSYPEAHPMVGRSLSNPAGDDFSRKWLNFERALRSLETAYGPAHWRVAKLLADMALNMMGVGDLERAREFADRAVAIGEASEVRGWLGDVLEERIHIYQLMGLLNLREALLSGERALEVALDERARGFHVACIMEGQAARLMSYGLRAEALEMQERALREREAYGGGPGHFHLGDTLRNLAEIRASLGEMQEATRLNRRSLRIHEEYFGERLSWELMNNLLLEAELLWAAGAHEGAANAALRLEGMRQRFAREAMLGLPERQSLSLTAGLTSGLDFLLSAALAKEGSHIAPQAADAVIQSRRVVLDSLAQRTIVAKVQREPELRGLDRAVLEARERLARLVVTGEYEKDVEIAAQVRQAILDKDRAELALASRSESFRRQHQTLSAGLSETWEALPQHGAVVGYVRFDLFSPGGLDSPQWPLERTSSYLAYVLRADHEEPRFFYLGPAAKIEQLVTDLRQPIWQLATSGDRAPSLSLRGYRRAAEALRSILWDPLTSELAELDLVFIVPDGELVFLNWGALPTADGRYLIEEPLRLQYLSAERDLAGPRATDRPSPGLLAMGDPAFSEPGLFSALVSEDNEVLRLARADLAAQGAVLRGRRSSCASFSDLRFEELPASAAELRSLAASWSHSSSALPPLVLQGAAANEAAFKARAPGTSVIHLATHGFYLGGSCKDNPSTTDLTLDSPLVLSGLALAGANHREAAGPDEEDGILTAEEIAALDLQTVDWAVLSGCETGVGEPRAGEGVFGLQRAFQIAGARTIIMSLWPVDDAATRDWMAALYRHRFVDNASTIDAVRNASLDLLNARREAGLSTHPFYWAGFVAAGDWR